MSFVCNSYILVCHSYVTRMSLLYHSYVIRRSHVCTYMSLLCHSYVLLCHSHVARMYSHVTRMLLACTRMSLVCHSYVLLCHLYVTFMSLVCVFIMNHLEMLIHFFLVEALATCLFTSPSLHANIKFNDFIIAFAPIIRAFISGSLMLLNDHYHSSNKYSCLLKTNAHISP